MFIEYYWIKIFRCHFERLIIEAFLKTAFIPLVNLHLMFNKFEDVYLYAYIALSLTIFIVKIIRKTNEDINNFFVILHSTLLLTLSWKYEGENYWLIHLTFLFLINHFAMKRISRKFDFVPLIDLSMTSLLFLTIFLINSCFWHGSF